MPRVHAHKYMKDIRIDRRFNALEKILDGKPYLMGHVGARPKVQETMRAEALLKQFAAHIRAGRAGLTKVRS